MTTPQIGDDGYLIVDTNKVDQGVYLRLIQSILDNPHLAWDVATQLAKREGHHSRIKLSGCKNGFG